MKAASGLAALLLVGCTATSSPVTRARGAETSASKLVRSAVELSCAEAGSGDGPVAGSQDVSAGGLTLEGLAHPLPEVASAADFGWRGSTGSARNARKSPADVAAGTGPVTVQLVDQVEGQALMWVPADQWHSSLEPRRWMTSTVVFDGCPDRDVTYFGGLFGPTPDSCLHLRITPAGAPVQEQRLRLDGRPC